MAECSIHVDALPFQIVLWLAIIKVLVYAQIDFDFMHYIFSYMVFESNKQEMFHPMMLTNNGQK